MNNQPADALIIGAGASGAAVVWSLSRAGIDVVCLEQGDWVSTSDYWHGRDDYEIARQTTFATSPNIRRHPEDYPVNDDETPISPLMFNAVGGSTILWTGHFPRFHPSDFRVRTLDGVANDWPLTYWDLEPFYELNDRNIGVAGLSGDPANPPRTERPLPPLGIDRAAQVFIRGLDKLGWHWWPSDAALITESYDDLRQSCNYCGPCDIGCPIGAMSSAHVTYWPKALAQGARLITHARVREVTVDTRGRATGAVYYDRDGAVCHQAASVVIVACNGIGTPRLLLNSVSAQFPSGLANSSGLVGKNLMFHPTAVTTGLFDEEVRGHEGPIGLLLHSQEFYETDPSRGFVRGLQLQMNRGATPLTVASGGILPADLIPWGTDHHTVMREHFGHLLTLTVMVEDLPEPENQVVIDPTLVDGHGIPAPKVTYRLSTNSLASLDYGVARSRELYEAAGAHTTIVNPLVRQAGGHLMGTARMGDNPGTSVVDRWGRSHDCPNLFIVDGSVFVTCSPVNPTSTIQALALRTADWIVANHRYVIT